MELRLKEKALADAAAHLVLKKKLIRSGGESEAPVQPLSISLVKLKINGF